MAEQNLGKLTIEINARLDKLEAQLKGAESRSVTAANKMESAFKNVAGAMGLAFGTAQIVDFAKEAVLAAAKVEGIRKAFERINDPNLLANLRKATRETVSDMVLMQNAVKANNFGIPVKELGTLLEFASRRAKDTGENVDYLVESIVTGISRKSIMILDNLGISATRLKEAMGGAALESKSVGEVTAAVAGIARQELAKMGDAVNDTGEKMKKLQAKWENFLVVAGKVLIPLMDGFIEFAGDLETIYNWLDKIAEKMNVGFGGLPKTPAVKVNIAQPMSDIIVQNKKVAKSYADIKAEIDALLAEQQKMVPGSKQDKNIQEKINALGERIGISSGPDRKTPAEIREQYYNALKSKAQGYYDWELQQIQKQVAEMQRAGMAEVDIETWKLDAMTKLLEDFKANNPIQREERSPEQIAADTKRAEQYAAEQALKDFNAGYGRETVDPGDRFIENLSLKTNDATDRFSQFWQEQKGQIDQFGNALASAFRKGGDEGTAKFIDMFMIMLQIVGMAGSMKGGKGGGGESPLGILGLVVGMAALHDGGTLTNTGGRVAYGPGFAGGTDFIVPPGYPRDSYPFRVESGERVTVTPARGVSAQEDAMNRVFKGIQMLNYNLLTNGAGGVSDLRVRIAGELSGENINLVNKKQDGLKKRYNP